MRRIGQGLLLGLAVALAACHGGKNAVVSQASADSLATCYPIRSLTAAKCRWEISEGANSYRLTGSLYLKPDSICYFRGSMMVEVFRGVVKQDSFLLINRVDRICYSGSNSFLSRLLGFPVSPQMLYLLFTADACEERYRSLGFHLTRAADRLTLAQPACRLEARLSDRRLSHIDLHGATTGTVDYAQFQPFGKFMLPAETNLSISRKQGVATIKTIMQDVILDREMPVNMQIPQGYMQVEMK
jgi:hypothetical protein